MFLMIVVWNQQKKNGNSELCCIQFIPLDFQLAFYPALLAVLFLRV